MPVETPVYDVLTAVLEAASPNGLAEGEVNPDGSTAVYSYRKDEHFEALWDMAATIPSWLDDADGEERTLVVSWDGMPNSGEGSINVADYVTPFDWALALSWSIVESKIEEGDALGEKALPNLRILILDLKSQEHLSSLGVRTFTVAGRALPWVHAYRPVGDEHLAMAALPDGSDELAALRSAMAVGSFGIDHMIEDLIDPGRLLKLGDERGASSRGDMKMLVDLWRSNLTRAGDRHHVGNLMAPLLLAEGLPTYLRGEALEKIEANRPLRSALRKLAGVLGLAGSESGDGNFGNANREVQVHQEIGGRNGLIAALAEEPDPFDRKQNIRVGLVDDQYELGFHHVLVHLLLGNQYRPAHKERWRIKRSSNADDIGGELWCEADAGRLFEALRGQSEVKDWNLPRHLDLDCDVLLLDLRLWTREDERKAFFSEALSVCETLGAEELKERDPSFKRAFKAAKRLASSDQEDSGSNDREASEIEALALLPLLLSHYDPSLPIVLFSSTQQREVVRLTAHRSNILTGFSKPILSGYGEEHAASDSLFDLIEEVRKAVHLHEARSVWERLPKAEWSDTLPVFTESSGGRGYVVYNYPGDQTDLNRIVEQRRKKNADGSPLTKDDGRNSRAGQPRIAGDGLKKWLRQYYVHYLMDGNYYDFCATPAVFLERCLVTENARRDPDIKNPIFRLPFDLDNFNNIGVALRTVRNRVTHGMEVPPEPSETQRINHFRLTSIFLFYLLLDFIERPQIEVKGGVGNALGGACRRALLITGLSSNAKHPSHFASTADAEWLKVVCYATLFHVDHVVLKDTAHISKETLKALGGLTKAAFPEGKETAGLPHRLRNL